MQEDKATMCAFYFDDEKFRKDIQILTGTLDRRIHRAVELDQLVLLQIELLQDKQKSVVDSETAEVYEALSARVLEIGEILQEIKRKLHSELLTLDAVPKDLATRMEESSLDSDR
jgi:hypothetical protein